MNANSSADGAGVQEVMGDDCAPAVPTGPGPQWITVDLDRIHRLPDRLKRLWPRDLLPAADADSASAEGSAASGEVGIVAPNAAPLPAFPSEVVRPRDLDVLSAWLTGFAAELNLSGSRLTVVVGAQRGAFHLELALCEVTCLAVLALRGEDFADFTGFEFLRRLDPDEVGCVCEQLADLIDDDCVLTLTYAGGCAGMEFLHRQGGTWSRPLLCRGEDGETIVRMEPAGAAAVRMLLAEVLTQLIYHRAGAP